MKEQNSKSYLLEFLNIYFNYKFIVEGLSTQYSINSKKLCKSFILHSCILNILPIQKDSQEKYISIKRKTYFCILNILWKQKDSQEKNTSIKRKSHVCILNTHSKQKDFQGKYTIIKRKSYVYILNILPIQKKSQEKYTSPNRKTCFCIPLRWYL